MRRAILVSAIATALVSMATPAEAAFPGRNGKIAYSTVDTGSSGYGHDIYVVNPDGGDTVQLTTANGNDADPDFSAPCLGRGAPRLHVL